MDDYVNFKIAKKLKEKGFKGLCLAYYTDDDVLYYNYSHKAGYSYTECYLSHNSMPKDSVSGKFVDVPTIYQIMTWLREEKKILITIIPQEKTLGYDTLCFGIYKITEDLYQPIYNGKVNTLVDSYEQTAIAGIEYVLDNLI